MELKHIVNSYNVTKIIGYLRRSRQDVEREKRTGEDTLTEQKELMNKILTGIEIPYETRTEIGSGESIEGRPVFKSCLADLRSGKFQAIAVKEITRLSRGSYSDAGEIVNLLNEKRIIIITPYKIYDPRNPVDARQIRFELFMAREEFEMTRERMNGAKFTYAAQGKWISGLAPFGYKLNKRTSRLEPVDESKAVVQLIFDIFLNGLDGKDLSYTAIATHLTKLQFTTPRGGKRWSKDSVKKILQNEAYMGRVRYKARETTKDGKRIFRPESEHIVVDDAHEPIISKEDFEAVQTKIANKVPLLPVVTSFEPNELAGLCVCSVCGKSLQKYESEYNRQNKDGTSSYFHVKLLICRINKCTSVRYQYVEEAILLYLKELVTLDNKEIKAVIEKSIEFSEKSSQNKSTEQMMSQAIQKEKEINNKLTFIYEKFESGIYSDEMFLQRKSALENELEDIKKLKQDLSLTFQIDDNSVNEFKYNITEFLQFYNESKSRGMKNKKLRALFKTVILKMTEKRRGPIPAKFEIYPYLRVTDIIK
ncbi:recombinase family protein [Bacillus sp. FSL R7-0651]|uniref:recombinase family protein n=1 Tax=unclassified Bacillus (in: firmicutes) TaxID=185979 RepID=UPI0031584352